MDDRHRLVPALAALALLVGASGAHAVTVTGPTEVEDSFTFPVTIGTVAGEACVRVTAVSGYVTYLETTLPTPVPGAHPFTVDLPRAAQSGIYMINATSYATADCTGPVVGTAQALVAVLGMTLTVRSQAPSGTWLRGPARLLVSTTAPEGGPVPAAITLYRAAPGSPGSRGTRIMRVTGARVARATVDTRRLRDGRHVFTAVVEARDGDTRRIRRAYRVDNTAPVVNGPSRALVCRGRPGRVALRATDAGSPRLVRSATIARDGRVVARVRARTVRDRGRLGVPIPALAPGAYGLTVRVEDLAGNASERRIPLTVTG